jgi:hypothetical protein
MSASGHQQTSRRVRVMSILPLKAAIRQRESRVRYVPEADIPSALESHPLLTSSRVEAS